MSIPVIGDADTGYGNALNVRRSVQGFARAGFAAVMLEDQVSPKRCGHTRGKAVVDLDEGGRLLGWVGDTIAEDEARIGLEVQVVPRVFEEIEPIKVYYTVERAGTRWGKAPR